MKITQQIKVWIETLFRERRYACATKPAYPAPSWITSAHSFDLLGANNPLTPIAATRICWIEQAADASRYLLCYALEIQAASDSLDASRIHIAKNNAFLFTDKVANPLQWEDQSSMNALERQRRVLTEEIEALCLLAGNLRHKLGSKLLEFSPSDVDKQHSVLKGMNLLAYFVGTKRLDAVEYMLFCGASPEAPCSDGSTPLALATKKANAFSGSSGSSSQESACILAMLEQHCLSQKSTPLYSQRPHRI